MVYIGRVVYTGIDDNINSDNRNGTGSLLPYTGGIVTQDLYNKALKAGEKSYKEAVSRGEFPYLPALDEIIRPSDISGEVPLGIMDLPLDQIVGTKTAGRQNSFAPNFMPLIKNGSEFAVKWSNVLHYQVEEGIKDPIKAYEYLGRYYVQEGNKRVSVFKFLGSFSIEADVIRIVPKRSEDTQVKIFYEYMDFYRKTEINSIWFSKEGGFAQLIALCGKGPDDAWSESEKRTLYDAYYRFSKIYRENGGSDLSITRGDAFLLYLQIHPYAEMDEKTGDQLAEEIANIWEEIELLDESPDRSVFLSPSEKNAPGFLTRTISGISAQKLKAAFIHEKPMRASGWVYGHELGRMYLEQAFDEKLKTAGYFMEDASADLQDMIDSAVADGNNIIFTTNQTMLPESLKAAARYPDIKFLNCSVNRPHNLLRTYYGRMYEAKFLEGMIAGAMTENDRIAYVADYPIFGSVAGINAFSLGAAMTNPRATVYLHWLGQAGSDLDRLLKEKEIRIVSDVDMKRPGTQTRQFGLYRISGQDTEPYGRITEENSEKDKSAYPGTGIENLAGPVWHWGKFYERIMRDIVSGSWKNDEKKHRAMNYWWGISGGVIDLILSQKLPDGIRTLTGIIRREICENTFHPFSGSIRTQDGGQLGTEGSVLTPEEIITMSVLVSNVVGRIPGTEELTPEGRRLTEIQGLFPDENRDLP